VGEPDKVFRREVARVPAIRGREVAETAAVGDVRCDLGVQSVRDLHGAQPFERHERDQVAEPDALLALDLPGHDKLHDAPAEARHGNLEREVPPTRLGSKKSHCVLTLGRPMPSWRSRVSKLRSIVESNQSSIASQTISKHCGE
jgi:hypothetical protein